MQEELDVQVSPPSLTVLRGRSLVLLSNLCHLVLMKCDMCNKKIPLVNEVMCKCRCSKVFCLSHRLPEQHECTHEFVFDLKLEKCVASKIK